LRCSSKRFAEVVRAHLDVDRRDARFSFEHDRFSIALPIAFEAKMCLIIAGDKREMVGYL